ncbi:hypothetical protein MBLNU13_g05054t1 [Cladosporium sp. NU13]
MSSAIARIQGLKETAENPPRDDLEGLDFQRCAALHNAIVEHGWTASERDDTTSRLHLSVIEFLKRAYDFYEDDFNFFHYLTGLRHAGDIELGFKQDLEDLDYDNRYYTLYCTDQTHASKPDGLIHILIAQLRSRDTLQRLESVLTVYIELIETGKIIAFHKDLEFADDVAFYNAHDPSLSGLRYACDRPNAMIVDPATRHAKKKGAVDPWVFSSTGKDLEDTLEMWKILVEAINDRIEYANVAAEPTYGLANDQLLDAMPDCFAKRFFARAMKPRFNYIAPGLRVQTIEELLDQPYSSSISRDGTEIPPILILRGEGMAVPTSPLGFYPQRSIPAGLYLEPCDPFYDAAPWEDGVALILPYNVGGRGSWARMADQKPFPERNDCLYQIGWNPFIARHPPQLLAILVLWYENLQSGNWDVDQDGVVGGMEKYREANLEEYCMEYVLEIGPGLTV